MKPIIVKVDITIGFSSPYPFEFEDISKGLAKKGYNLPSGGQITIAFSPEGRQVELKKMVAKNVEITYNQENGHVTVTSNELKPLRRAVHDILSELQRKPLVENQISWFEINYNGRVLTDKHPLDREKMKRNDKSALLDELTGLRTQPFSRVLCAFGDELPKMPLNKIPNWLHVSVHPFVPNPSYYYVNIVYRRDDLDRINTLLNRVDEVIKDIIADM